MYILIYVPFINWKPRTDLLLPAMHYWFSPSNSTGESRGGVERRKRTPPARVRVNQYRSITVKPRTQEPKKQNPTQSYEPHQKEGGAPKESLYHSKLLLTMELLVSLYEYPDIKSFLSHEHIIYGKLYEPCCSTCSYHIVVSGFCWVRAYL